MKDKREDLIVTMIIVMITSFLIGVIVICIIFYKPQHNHGICTDCGGQYEFVQAVGHHLDTSYIYKCNKCGKIIEVDEIIK